MLIPSRHWGVNHPHSSEITPRSVYEDRRQMLRVMAGGRAARILYTLAGLFVAAGAVMYIVAFATGQRGLATTAATLTFAGLGFAFVYLSWKALQREPPLRRAAFRMVPDDAEDDDVDSPDDFDADENLAKDDLTEEDDSPRRGM